MALFTDIQYLKRIAVQLPNFKQKSEFLWNCKCILCGDGAHNKTRGYFFKYNNKLFYKCHHCGASMPFGYFLRQLDQTLYGEYALETFKEDRPNQPILELEHEEPTPSGIQLTDIATPLDAVEENNPALQYCLQRNIPSEALSRLWYIEHTKDIIKLYPQYEKRYHDLEEPRLVIPFYSVYTKELIGVTMRALGDNKKRYLVARNESEEPLIFGWDTIDITKPVYIVEGPLDSLFLDNCIAVGGTSFEKIIPLNLDDPIMIFDNQPRNKEVTKIINKFIMKEFKVCIWPCGLPGKDINELINHKYDVKKLIQENTYQGLMAQIKFNDWKNC